MKALRVISNIIIGIILFALVFTLLFIRETNKIVSTDLLKETLNNIVDDTKSENEELTESQKNIIDDMFKDEDAKEIAKLILINYKEYRNDENYSISEEDFNTFYGFIYKYRSHIKDSKIEKMTDIEFKEYYNKSKINEMANDTFKNFDRIFDSKVIDNIIKGYSLATSYFVRAALIFVILFFIAIICIINWSLIKWMLVFGFSLIASGLLFNLLYNASELIKRALLNENINININLNPFLFVSIVQIVLGIALVVLYCFLKEKYSGIVKKDNTQL